MSLPTVAWTALGPLSDHAAACLLALDIALEQPVVLAEIARRKAENDVVVAMIVLKRARAQRRPLTCIEAQLVQSAEALVERGIQPPALFKPIERFGRRAHPTLVSIADGGEGHLGVVLRDLDLLDGALLHHESIQRVNAVGELDANVAPYRMIDIRQNGIVRLHAADDVPVTVYCGQPNYYHVSTSRRPCSFVDEVSAAFARDPLTPSLWAAAAASAAFANTAADVEFSFDGLTATQAIQLMQAVQAAVDRQDNQLLSTQFNLYRPLLDDRVETLARTGRPTLMTAPAQIAEISAVLTHAGGWDRVTLDSASHKIPSVPSTSLLGFEQLTTWVHQAHSYGLETYSSGGMCDLDMSLATCAGVDAVGIGRWLHFPDPASGSLGGIDRAKLRATLQARNVAERSVAGTAARLLAEVTRAHFDAGDRPEPGLALLRQALLEGILSRDERRLSPLIRRGAECGFLGTR